MNAVEIADAVSESEELECKESWTDDSLKAVSAMANTRGGVLLIGISDDRKRVPGWHDDGKKQEGISSQIVSSLQIHPTSISVQDQGGTPVLVIHIGRSPYPVAMRGRYYRRVGNSTREVPGEELPRFLLERTGESWDAVPCQVELDALSEETYAAFKLEANPRLPQMKPADTIERVLGNIGLRAPDGHLLRAAVMLFGEGNAPQRVMPSAFTQMGRFKGSAILDDKSFKGNLFEQLESSSQQFRQYLQVGYSFPAEMGERSGLEVMQRTEIWDYPLPALREAVANALIHRDYTEGTSVMIRVYDDRVMITSPGGLPCGISISDLYRDPHPSMRRNPLLAEVFYYARIIERWGSGTTRMVELCRAQGLPDPLFEATAHEFKVTFFKVQFTDELLRRKGLSDRQVRAVRYVQEKGSISNAEYRGITGVSERSAVSDLKGIAEQGIFHRPQATGRGTRYVLANPQNPQ